MADSPRFQPDASLDVVGIGNAIVDVLVQTQDGFLSERGLQKGGMCLINEQQAEDLYRSSGPGLETSGGSVANTMVGNTVDGALSKVGSNTVSSCVGN